MNEEYFIVYKYDVEITSNELTKKICDALVVSDTSNMYEIQKRINQLMQEQLEKGILSFTTKDEIIYVYLSKPAIIQIKNIKQIKNME